MAWSDARSCPVPMVIWIERIATHVAALDDFGRRFSAQLLRSSLCVVTPLAQRRELIEVRKRLATALDWDPVIDRNRGLN